MTTTALRSGERQVAPSLRGIRRDHVARYEWAAARCAGLSVVDVGCGIGYGAAVLADAGCTVRAVDRSEEALAYGEQHFARPGIAWVWTRAEWLKFPQDADVVVAFEVLEHLEDPAAALENWAALAPRLLLSVPNEDVFPYTGQRFHRRHYRPAELEFALREAGWTVVAWFGQAGMHSEVEPDVNGRTLIVEAARC